MSQTTAMEGVEGVLLSSQSQSGLSISVHPLVILNISDHYTRIKLQNPAALEKGRVYGALLATQIGRTIELMNSCELPANTHEEGQVTLNNVYLSTKLDQLKQVFPLLDFIGWYSLGESPTEADLHLHQQFLPLHESCLFLQMNPKVLGHGIKEFPVSIYESVLDIVHETTRLGFVKASYRVETNEAERIAIEQVAKPSTSDTGAGLVIAHLTTQKNAIAMLNSRIQFLQGYLKDVMEGVMPVDHTILRQLASVCRGSPVIDSMAFNEQFSTEYNDVLLVTYLATITQGMNILNNLIDKHNLVHGHGKTTAVKSGTNVKKGRVRT
ncbi:maintenance of mitochondrial structure and function-domain-containing protein [Spinellus fusiger]|nr:maintenance of mitochondrial structure and function-domain-containing protein [Spinellus fusiger]